MSELTMTDREALVAPLLRNYDNNPEEAVVVFRQAINAGVSNHPDVLLIFALHLLATSNWEEAEVTLRQVLEAVPKHVLALYNLGCLLLRQKRMEEAEFVCQQTLDLDPAHVDTLINLANIWRDQMYPEKALTLIRRAAKLAPTKHLPASFEFFESVYAMDSTDATIGALARKAADLLCGGVQQHRQMLANLAVKKEGERPLRVGFVSGDFKSHPVGFFLQAWLPHVDRARLVLHAFSMRDVDDGVAQNLRPQFETWHDISSLSDEAVQALVAELGIDVLVDLSGHTDLNRLPLFARRAAPVQISWLGWYATTGIVNMDYFLTDRISSPASSQAHHSERLLYLPGSRLCMCEPISAPPVSPLPALQNKHITFGSFQSVQKVTDATLLLWRQVLAHITEARFIICSRQFEEAKMLTLFRQRLASFDLPLKSIELLPSVSYVAYLESYQNIDLMLDTIPFSGGTTTAEALWMGVPTLTLLGNTLIARQGASLMSAAGLGNWVADSAQAYIAKASYWSEHLAELAMLRSKLREAVRASPLFDSPRFANAFTEAIESAYNAKLLLQPLRDL